MGVAVEFEVSAGESMYSKPRVDTLFVFSVRARWFSRGVSLAGFTHAFQVVVA